MTKSKRRQKKSRFYLFFLVLFLIAALIPFGRRWYRYLFRPAEGIYENVDLSNALDLTFVDVGQGDCAVLRIGKWSALIDTGVYDAYDSVKATLETRGIDHLDAVFISHPHYDHAGCLQSVLLDYPVGHVYFADIPEEFFPTADWYDRILDMINRKSIPLSILHAGDRVETDDPGTFFEVLWSGGGSNMNNCSMVLRLNCNGTHVLFMGDAEREVEEKLISSGVELSSLILKVGHHGTRYGTHNKFVNIVVPQYAIISCAKDNEFGYPKDEVLDRLKAVGAAILRTDLQGSVHFVVSEGRIQYETEENVE